MLQTLIITNSNDQTVDVLLERVPKESREKIFRLNFDLFQNYKFKLSASDFYLADPIGRVCTLDSIKKVYYRKPRRNTRLAGEAAYVQEELWYAMRGFIHLLWQNEKIVLVEPHVEISRLNKITQLRAAQKFFYVPEATFELGMEPSSSKANSSVVVKSLTSTQIGNDEIFTTQINPNLLDRSFPWLIQDYIEAGQDITVVYVRGKIFAFELQRNFLKKGVDWREHQSSLEAEQWNATVLPTSLIKNIQDFMCYLRLDYGRLDFLLDKADKYHFLEVNPNGQYAWLDLMNTVGMLSCIVEEISPDTQVFPIPYNPFRN